MFLEVIVTNAIIIGFILNVIFVAHPDTTSYTIYFVVGLLLESPFILLWRWWKSGFSFRGWKWKWKCRRRCGAGWKLAGNTNDDNDDDGNEGGANERLLPLVNARMDAAEEEVVGRSPGVVVERSSDAVPAVANDEDVISLERDLEMGLVGPSVVNDDVSGS